jgi:serine phosphatase RsbU (regulator of sigma subunit)
MHKLPLQARIFIGVIFLLGLLAVLVALYLPVAGVAGKSWELILFIALGVLAGRTKVRLIPGQNREDRGSLTLSFALIFATLLSLGPGPAMLVGGFSTLASCFYPKRQALHQVLFNLGLSALATCTAGWIFIRINGGLYSPLASGPTETVIFTLFLAVMISCLSFFLINTFAVATIINFTNKQPLLTTWWDNCLWLAPSYFASASAGTLAIVILRVEIGPVLLFVTPVAALTYLAYTLSRRGAEESENRIQELQTHEAQLAEELRREHLIAETLQQALLLPLAEDAFSGLIVQTAYQPAWNEALVGGDFHDAVRLPGDKVALVVGDVTGKGLAAATYMAQVKFALRAILHECPEPTEALSRLNRFLMQDQPDGGGVPLVAVALAVVDPQTGDTAVSSAGAEHPLLLRANGTAEEIRAGGMLLGTLPDSRYEAAELRLAPGDCLLMVTDGLTEARHESDFFGYTGLIQAAREAQAALSSNIGHAIIAEAKRFTGGTMHDDVCLLLVRREVPRLVPTTVVFSPGESAVSTRKD